MTENNNFNDFYNSNCIEKLKLYSDTYFSLFKQSKKKVCTLAIVVSIIAVIIFILSKVYEVSIALSIVYLLAVGTGIFFLYSRQTKVIKNNLYVDINKMLYLDILSFIASDENISFNPNSRIAKEYFKNSKLFNLDIYNYNGENYTTCSINNEKVLFSDIFIYNYKYKTLIDYFSENGKTYKRTTYRKIPQKQYKGLYIEIPFHEKLTSTVYLISSQLKNLVKDRMNGVLIYEGKRVELENLHLEKDYNIYSNDETLARYIFNLPYMERVLDINKYISNKKNIVYRTDNKLSVFIENYTIDEIIKRKIEFNNNIISKAYIEKVFSSIMGIVNVISILQTNK